MMPERVIEVRPATNALLARVGTWQVFEGDGVQPVFPPPNARDLAITYARQRAGYSATEIRVLDEAGNVVEVFVQENTRGLV